MTDPSTRSLVHVYIHKARRAAHVVSGAVFVLVIFNSPPKQYYRCFASLTNKIMHLKYFMKSENQVEFTDFWAVAVWVLVYLTNTGDVHI